MGLKPLPLMDMKSGRCPWELRTCGEQWQDNVEGYFGCMSRKNITAQLFVRRLVGLIYVAKRVPPAASHAGGSPFEDVFGLFVAANIWKEAYLHLICRLRASRAFFYSMRCYSCLSGRGTALVPLQ